MREPKINFSQQFKLVNPQAMRPVTLIGAGAVGSHVAVGLASMGVTDLTVYDEDYVESHNVAMSEYVIRDLSKPKVIQLAALVEAATGVKIDARRRHYAGEPLSGSVVCCADKMAVRKLVWERVRMNSAVDILVDTRTNAMHLKVFAVDPCDPEDIEFYEYFLRYSDEEASQAMCGRHGTKTVSWHTAAAACDNLTSWWQHGRKKLMHEFMAGCLDCIE